MIHLTSLLHTMSAYANRWGGPRYRTEELAKFLNKHLYNAQEYQLQMGEKVNTCLASDAFISSRHTPIYLSSIRKSDIIEGHFIKDELGFEAVFAEGTEILIHRDDQIKFEKIENIVIGDLRVINFEKVNEFNNDKLHHHLAHSENFISIRCSPDEVQMVLCDGLTAMTVLKEEGLTVKRVDQFDSANDQEIYLSEITDVHGAGAQQFYYVEFSSFSYSLKKNRALSNKSKHRYWKHRIDTRTQRWLEKMRSKVFRIKKSPVEFEMELKHVENKD